jgi:long-chain acyl-CoA synthetase
VGLLLPGQTVRLVDSAGEPVAQGQAGEVVIKGPNVMRGYLNRPEESAKTLVDGWLRAGDIGRFDEDGYRPGDHRRTIPAPAAAYRSGPFR